MRARIRTIDGITGDQWVFRLERSELLTSARSSIDIYDTSEEAVDWLEWERERTPHSSGIRFENVVISDSIDVTLWPLFWERSADALYMYTDPKLLYTDVRIGNVRIRISEDLSEGSIDNVGNLTNQILQEIVDAFEAAELHLEND